jgi:hypothetical protein
VQPFTSAAEVTKGNFIEGDLAVEETHVYPYTPLRVFIRADLPFDNPLADTLRATVAGIPGYELAKSQRDSDFMLMVIRPLRQRGQFVKARKEDTLPEADPTAKPEIWVLTPGELPTREKMEMLPATGKRTVELVSENLKKMSRILELKQIGEPVTGGAPLVELIVNLYSPDPKCQAAAPVCLDVPDKGKYVLVATLPYIQMQGKTLKKGDVLTFHVKNNSPSELYCYLLDITPNGKITAVFPGPQDSNSSVMVPASKEQNFSDLSGLEVEEPGEDTVKLIATQAQLDVSLFEQGGYKTRGETRGSENPLENFLSRSMGNVTRGPFSMKNNQWGTVSFSFEVE